MQCPHTRKSCHCHRCYCRFTSPRSHHILIAVTNAVEGFSNGVGCRRTGSHHTGYIAVCIHINGSTSRCQIDQGHGNEIRRDTAWSTAFNRLGRALNCGNTTDSRTDDHSEAIAVEFRILQTAVFICLLCGYSCKLCKAVIEFQITLCEILLHIQISDRPAWHGSHPHQNASSYQYRSGSAEHCPRPAPHHFQSGIQRPSLL